MKRKSNLLSNSNYPRELLEKPQSELPLQSPQAEKKQKIKHPYTIQRIPLDDPEYASQTPEYLQNKEIPGFPTTCIAVGEPGSGKTNLLLNLLVRGDFWNGFFDRVYYLGPTINADASYKILNIPHDRKVTEQGEFIPKLEEWVNEQIQAVEHDRKTAPKCLFIFEDITAYYYTAQQSPVFAKCFTAIRHHKAVAYANIHKFKALNRTARQCGRHLMIWPVTLSERFVIYEDYAPKRLKKEDFAFMCEVIWKPDEEQQKPFLYINKYADEEKRYRRCFTDYINVNKFVGSAKNIMMNPGQDPYFLQGTGRDTTCDNPPDGLEKECACQTCSCRCCTHPRKKGGRRTVRPRYQNSKGNQNNNQNQNQPSLRPVVQDGEKRKELTALSGGLNLDNQQPPGPQPGGPNPSLNNNNNQNQPQQGQPDPNRTQNQEPGADKANANNDLNNNPAVRRLLLRNPVFMYGR